jgi:hypothetical protein
MLQQKTTKNPHAYLGQSLSKVRLQASEKLSCRSRSAILKGWQDHHFERASFVPDLQPPEGE